MKTFKPMLVVASRNYKKAVTKPPKQGKLVTMACKKQSA